VHETKVDGVVEAFVCAPNVEGLLDNFVIDFDSAWIALVEPADDGRVALCSERYKMHSRRHLMLEVSGHSRDEVHVRATTP